MKMINFLVLPVSLLVFSACADLPLSVDFQKSVLGGAKSAFFKHPKHVEIAGFKELKDKALNAYVTRVGERVRAKSSAQGLNYKIVDTDIIQAVSGSDIYISRGMLEEIQNEAELACLIGHELGHHVQQDKDPSDSANDSHLAETFFIHAPDVVQGFGVHNDIEKITNANYSKGKETAADEQGSLLCASAGYDAYALSSLEERLALQIETSVIDSVKNLTGTHDQLRDRSQHLRTWLNEHEMVQSQGKLGVAEYVNALQALIHFTPAEISTLKSLAQTEKNAKDPAFFETNMRALSRIVSRENITADELQLATGALPGGDHFMQEIMRSQKRKFGNFRNRAVSGVSRVLSTMGKVLRIGTLAAMVGFYDAWTGKDFMNDHPLSPVARELHALLYGQSNNWNVPLREQMPAKTRMVWDNAQSLSSQKAEPTTGDRYANDVPMVDESAQAKGDDTLDRDQLEPGDVIYSCIHPVRKGSWFSVASHRGSRPNGLGCEPNQAYQVREVVGGYLESMAGKKPDQFLMSRTIPVDQVLKRIF